MFRWFGSPKVRLASLVAGLGAAALAISVSALPAALADNEPAPAHQAAQATPISLGTSGGNINNFLRGGAFCSSGTLGSLVRDADGAQYILSNNHVLARTNNAIGGEDIIQPGLIDQIPACAKDTNDAVADLSAFVPISFKKGTTNTVDAAIAGVRTGKVAIDGNILDVGTISNLTATDKVGCAVRKSGRTTGDTTGSISAVNVTVDINYGGGKVARFVDQFLVTPGAFSAGGDSGSLIVRDGSTPRAVGLLFAGSSSYTIANPIAAVSAAFGTTMVGTGVGSTGDCPDPAASPASAGAAKGRHEAALFEIPGVVGVGVGAGPAVEVYLAQDSAGARRRIPARLEDVPVRVVVTGEFHAL